MLGATTRWHFMFSSGQICLSKTKALSAVVWMLRHPSWYITNELIKREEKRGKGEKKQRENEAKKEKNKARKIKDGRSNSRGYQKIKINLNRTKLRYILNRIE